jgi:hypothetical protein
MRTIWPCPPERSLELMRSREVDEASGVGGGAPTPLLKDRGPLMGVGPHEQYVKDST